MTRYPLSLRDRLRFRFGLLWATHLPAWPDLRRRLTWALYLTVALCGYATISNREYAEDMAAEAAAQAESNRALTRALATCISTWADADEPHAHFIPTTQESI